VVLLAVLACSPAAAAESKATESRAAASARAASSPISCTPSKPNASALLGGGVTVTPQPGSRDASSQTQISFLGVAAGQISSVSVVGSRSGTHGGRLAAYSQGDGASFLPSQPLAQGERVRVRAELAQAGGVLPIAWSFQVAVRDTAGSAGGSTPPPINPHDYQIFRSRPDLRPPPVTVSAHSPAAGPGDIFVAPYSGPGQYGPMILDENGALVWFEPLAPGARAADLRVQSYEGQPVLTWWQDPLVAGGSRAAGLVIANDAYKTLAVVRAGNGYQPDLHEFQITPQGTALITVYDAIDCDLTAVGGPRDGALADTLLQEIDLKTGLVTYEWHSLDHVSLSDSYAAASPGSRIEPFDYFHINSIDVEQDGDLLVDARNTWAAYDIDPRTGQVRWRLGGRRSSFALGSGAVTAWQHDARQQPNGDISFFDNGATPRAHPQSRAIELSLDTTSMTATLVQRYEHSPPLLAGSQGNMQALANGSWMVGWGQAPYFSEYSASGQLLFDARLPSSFESYRTYRLPWSAQPAEPPAMFYVRSSSPHGAGVVYASWNGATAVASWRVLSGASPASLTPLASRARTGFESAIHVPALAGGSYVAVQALDASGAVIGVSPARKL
jgi:hypothetical protein